MDTMREWTWETPDWEAPPWSSQIKRVADHGNMPLPEVIDFYDQVWDSSAAVTLWLLEGNPARIAESIRDGEDPTIVAPDVERGDLLLAAALHIEPTLARKAAVGACMHDSNAPWQHYLLELRCAVECRLGLRQRKL